MRMGIEPPTEPYNSEPPPHQYYQQTANPPAPAHGYYGPLPQPSCGAAPVQPAPASLDTVEQAVVDLTVGVATS